MLIQREPTLEMVGTAVECEEAWTGIAQSRPDVVLMDLDVPGEGGMALTERILQTFPATKVIVLTGQGDSTVAAAALRAGALGFILKIDAADELILALRAVEKGEVYVTPRVASLIAEGIRGPARAGQGLRSLSAREADIVRRIADGQTTKEIAFDLQLSTKTVETHRTNLMRKIGVKSVADVTKFAVRQGLAKL